MSKLDEIRKMKDFVQAAAQKKQELDRINAKQHVSSSMKRAVARKKELGRKSIPMGFSIPQWLTPANVCLAFFFVAGTFLCFNIYSNVYASNPNMTSSYAKGGDFKRAEKFANRFLSGKYTERGCYLPGREDSLSKSAAGLFPCFEGAVAKSVAVSDLEEGKSIVLKATCPKAGRTACIYLTPSGKNFYVSGIEVDSNYAENETVNKSNGG